MSKFYFYMNGPIDFGWANHPSIQEVESRFTDEGEDDPCSLSEWRELLCCLETAKVFKNKSKYNQGIYSWFEGKFADGPVVCFVPGTDLYFSAILVWKQHNNGSVFTLPLLCCFHTKIAEKYKSVPGQNSLLAHAQIFLQTNYKSLDCTLIYF